MSPSNEALLDSACRPCQIETEICRKNQSLAGDSCKGKADGSLTNTGLHNRKHQKSNVAHLASAPPQMHPWPQDSECSQGLLDLYQKSENVQLAL